MKQDLFKQFIVGLPHRSHFDATLSLKRDLYKGFYYAVANDGEYLEELFPKISHVELMELTDYKFYDKDNNAFYLSSNDDIYTHPQGTVCARPLKKGEPVYRCEDCGFDSTCVLCIHCFNEEAHLGHNVQMYISSESSNGICDCGDVEAFQGDLNCKCQKFQPVSNELQHGFQNSIKVTLRIILDYILDVTNFSVTTLPFIHDNINKSHTILSNRRISELSSLPSNKYGTDDVNSSEKWLLVLWNDEFHNFQEATEAIIKATGVDNINADEMAQLVSDDGRCILKSAASPEELFSSLDTIEAGGLTASIMTARDFMREEIIQHMISWVHELLNFTSHSEFRAYVRKTLAQLLLEPDYSFLRILPQNLTDGLSIDVPRRCFENGLLLNGDLVNYGLCKLKDDFRAKDLLKPISQVLIAPKDNFFNSRIQFLMIFSLRFKSSVRRLLPQVLIPPVVAESEVKATFCSQYIQIYPQLLTSLALSDREEQLSLIGDVSSQLMTCPTSVQSILNANLLGNVLGPLAQIIEEHAGRWNYDSGYPNFTESTLGYADRNKSLYDAIARGLHDAAYLTDSSFASASLGKVLTKHQMGLIVLLLRNFQGYWPVKRKYGDHVEREVLDFVVHLRYSVPILKLAKQVAESFSEDHDSIKVVIKLLIGYLFLRPISHKAPGIANFRVAQDSVSFVHPINSLLSYLIQTNDFQLSVGILGNLNKPFMSISDISLRSIVLGAQVRIGFWIRNGISVSRQASLYLDSVMADTAYRRDMHLNQIAAICDDPKSTLYNFLDRWDLFDWFANNVPPKETIYEHRFGAIVERFILFLYNLIADRSAFTIMSKDERNAFVAKKLILYSLCGGPKSYSDVKDHIDSEINEDPNFDSWIAECADYQPPTSMIDSGLYRLKPEKFLELDPFSMYLDSSESQDVSESICKNLAKTQNIKEGDVIIPPSIVKATNDHVNLHVASFTKTVFFAKLVYKLLTVAIDTKEETYLAPLLHLVHTVLLDDEMINGEDHIPADLVEIPIGDLLLNIIESTMSKPIVSKADYLLNQFIAKDKRVLDSLVDCFGEKHVDDYIKRKTGKFESDSERKKRMASERTAKVMKKFAKQRKMFLDKNSEFEVTDQTDSESAIERRNCVLCGEPESSDEAFGILASTLTPSILWKVPVDDSHMFQGMFGNYDDEHESPPNYGQGYKYKNYPKQDDPLVKGLIPRDSAEFDAFVASTCSHGMHYSCYKRSTGRAIHYSCHLCHTMHNIFIPSFLPPEHGGGLTVQDLNSPPVLDSYNKILHSSSVNKSRMLIKSMFHKDLSEQSLSVLRRNLDVFYLDFNSRLKKEAFIKGTTPKVKYFNLLQNISLLIADTIRMNEISSRLDGSKGYTHFLDTVTGSTKTLLKSLVQIRAMLYELRESPNMLGPTNLSEEIARFWQSDYLVQDTFTEVVMLFFQTDESFKTLAHVGMIKMFTLCFYSIMFRCNFSTEFFLQTKEIPSTEISDETQQALTSIFCFGAPEVDVPEQLADHLPKVFSAIEKCMLPFLKQLVIFKDILTSTNEGSHQHTSLPEVQNLPNAVKNQDRIDSSDALCDLLQLPRLKDLVIDIRDETSFEYKIFDVVSKAKIPKYYESGVLTLDYPGPIKFIDLPQDYRDCLTDINKAKTGAYDNYICLICGDKLPSRKYYEHMGKCASNTGVFFHPAKNNIRVVSHIGSGPVSLLMPGPYLTVHGEVKEARAGGNASLSDFRYKELTKSWMNQSLYAFITRTLYGSRRQATTFEDDSLSDEDLGLGRWT